MQKIALSLLLILLTNSFCLNAQDSFNASPNSTTADTSCKNFFTSWDKFKECAIQWGGNTAITVGMTATSLVALALMKRCCKVPAQRTIRRIIQNLQPQRLILDIKNVVKRSISTVENDPDILIDLDGAEYPDGSYIGKFAVASGEKIETLLHKLRGHNQLLAHLKEARGIILICGNFSDRPTNRRSQHLHGPSSTSREIVKAVCDIFIEHRAPLFLVHVDETSFPAHQFTVRTQTIADITSSEPRQSLKVRGLDARDPAKILYQIKPEISLRAVLFTETNKELYVRRGVAQCFMGNFLQNLQKRPPAARATGDIESGQFSAV